MSVPVAVENTFPQGAAPAPFCVCADTLARLYALMRGEGHTEGLISGVK